MRIDHLVWYGSDLAQNRRQMAGILDAEPVYGGEHPGEGTANAVVSLGPSTYLEVLGRDPAQEEVGLDPELASLKGMGLYHWAVGGVDLEEARLRAEEAGFVGSKLVSGGRRLPSGKRLAWTCFGIRGHGFGSLIPFFIDWMDSDHPAASAPLGGRLVQFEALTPKPTDLASIYNVFGLDISVREAEESAFVATVGSSHGHHKFKSFSPLPGGFVI